MDIAPKKARLRASIPRARALLKECTLCPRMCRVDRTKGQKGLCATLDQARVASFTPHFGEEPPLSGSLGSGTIFFSGCNLGCCFCQNHDISIQAAGEIVSPDQIAQMMLILQDQGCHNINFVTPTHVVPFILEALDLALDQGFALPLVYNTSGYETPDTLDLLEGIVDIFLPDFKFWDPNLAKAACNAPDYPKVAKAALSIMHRQKGDLLVDPQGIAISGLLVRHLVLPGTLEDICQILAFLSKSISPGTRINLMSQYRPLWQAGKVPSLMCPVSPFEYREAVRAARQLGLVLVD